MLGQIRWGTLSLLVGFLVIVWVWQTQEYQAKIKEIQSKYDVFDDTVMTAVEGAIKRPCLAAPGDLGSLRTVLEDVRARLGVNFLGLCYADGEPFVGAGVRDSEPREGMRKRIRDFDLPAPISCRAQHAQHSKGKTTKSARACGSVVSTSRPKAPPSEECTACGQPAKQLQVELHYSIPNYDGDIRNAGVHALALASAFSLALASLFLYSQSLLRAAVLRSDLAASAERVHSLEFLGRLSAGLAHETKNPLGAIRGFAEVISTTVEDSEQRQAAGRIVDETDRLVARVDEFLLLSRPADLRREFFPLKDLAVEISELMQFDLEQEQYIEVVGDSPTLNADREQVRRLLLNLLVNACENLGEGKKIEITIRDQDTDFELAICDQGSGIPVEIEASVFEPYVTARKGGTGLGLAIARRIAQEHGWQLGLSTRESWSTCILIQGKKS